MEAIHRISKNSYMKKITNIDVFFSKNKDFERIRKAINGSYDEFKSEEIPRSSDYTLEDLEYTFTREEEWPN